MWPSIPKYRENEMKDLKYAKSIRVELEQLGKAQFSEGAAVVNCRKTLSVLLPESKKEKTGNFDSTIRLRRNNGTWLIESIEDVVRSR
jgi:hypothetical protein